MKKKWTAALLALSLCMPYAIPATALAETDDIEVLEIEDAPEISGTANTTSQPDDFPSQLEDIALPEPDDGIEDISMPQSDDIAVDAAATNPDGNTENTAMPQSDDIIVDTTAINLDENVGDTAAAEPGGNNTDTATEPDGMIGEATDPDADILPPEAVKISEDEWSLDLSEILDNPENGLPEASADLEDVTPVTAAEQTGTALNADNFPDAAFRAYLKKFDLDKDESLGTEELTAVTEIDVIGKGIGSLAGLQHFPALETLQCDNNNLTALDVSQNAKLGCLTCSGNKLASLDLSGNPSLFSLVCSDNQISALQLGSNTNLWDLRCAGNRLQELDISKNPLSWLDCSRNTLTTLDASNQKNLIYLFCGSNQLASLNVTGAAKLQWLDCSNNRLTELDVSGVLNVSTANDSAVNLLNCADNQLTSLNLSNKTYFKGLVCSNNKLASLDLSTDPDLRQLECAGNELASLDVTQNTKLQTLDCSGNRLTSLDLSKLSITATSVLPNCSGQELAITLQQSETGLQINLKELIGIENCNIIRMTEEAFSNSTGSEKSTKGNVILLAQENEEMDSTLENGILTFTGARLPETIRLFCATGYKKKAGEKDVLLEINLRHTHPCTQTEKKEPTCTENGSIYQNCTECGVEFKAVLPALGHNYQQTASLAPSCTKDGVIREKCSRCGTETETALPALGHNYQQTANLAPSCTKDGVIRKKCSRCGQETETVFPATGHTYGTYKVTQKATIFKAGVKSRTCSKCGAVQTDTIPKLDGTVKLSTGSMPIQIKEKVSVQSLVTDLKKNDYVTSWTSGNPKVATIAKDGTITAKKTGKTKITVTTKSGATAVMTVKVQKKQVTTEAIVGLEKSRTLKVGKKLTLNPTLEPISSQQKITYKSSNGKIASVSAKGVVKGLKKGTAKITVKSGSKKFVVSVKVTAPAVKKIKNVPSKKTLGKGKTLQLKPKLSPSGSSGKITYKSSNKKVAAVTAKGLIKAKKKGSAKITVTVGKIKTVCKIVVR